MDHNNNIEAALEKAQYCIRTSRPFRGRGPEPKRDDMREWPGEAKRLEEGWEKVRSAVSGSAVSNQRCSKGFLRVALTRERAG